MSHKSAQQQQQCAFDAGAWSTISCCSCVRPETVVIGWDKGAAAMWHHGWGRGGREWEWKVQTSLFVCSAYRSGNHVTSRSPVDAQWDLRLHQQKLPILQGIRQRVAGEQMLALYEVQITDCGCSVTVQPLSFKIFIVSNNNNYDNLYSAVMRPYYYSGT